MKPDISVLVSVYNGEQFLAAAIASVAKQTFTNYEMIIVNDGSTDNTKALLDKQAKEYPFLKPIHAAKNQGTPVALNIGLKECSGEYVSRLDADDMFTPELLEKEYDFLVKHPEYNTVICDEQKVDKDGAPKYMLLKLLDDYYIKKQNLFRTAYGGPTTLIKREIMQSVGGFNEKMRFSCDRDIALRMHSKIKIGHVPERLYLYREHGGNISQHNQAFKQGAWYRRYMPELLKKCFNLNDYINDPAEIEKFKDIFSDYQIQRRNKYSNVILKCALHLAEYGDKKAALRELEKAQQLSPELNYSAFKALIELGFKKYLQKFYVNMNVWTDYAYDDFCLVDA